MATYTQYLKLMLWLYLALTSMAGAEGDERQQQQQQLDSLHRSKRTLTTICVEIKPSGPQEEPYYMCKGADFRGGSGQQEQHPQSLPLTLPLPQQPNAQPVYQQATPIATFPSFPAFGGGYLPVQPVYEDPSKSTQTTTYQEQPQSQSGPSQSAEQYSAPSKPASPAQSYGLSAVPYPASGSPSAAARGATAGSGPAATPITYNPAAIKKPSTTAKVTPKKTSNPSYESPALSSRYRPGLDEDVLALPNVGFQMEEFNQQYRRPSPEPQSLVGAVQQQQQQPQQPQPMIWLPQPQVQPQPVLGMSEMPDYHDDPVMRAFYASLHGSNLAPQLGATPQMVAPPQQAAPPQVEPTMQLPAKSFNKEKLLATPGPSPVEPMLGQNIQIYTSGGPPTMPPPPPPPMALNSYDTSCNSAPSSYRQCPTAASENGLSYASNSCPTFQPVIIAMPCFGQQRPTHYLAMPNPSLSSQAPLHDHMVGSPLGFGMSPQVGNPFGMNAQMVQPGYAMNPQVGSSYSMSNPQVGGPFGIGPILNPFGPLGSLNPFNPFGRLLGSAAPTSTPQPSPKLLHQWLGLAGKEPESTTTVPAVDSTVSTASQSSSTAMTTTSSEQHDAVVGASLESEESADEDGDGEEDDEEDAVPATSEASPEALVGKSLDSSEMTAQQLVDKATDKLKSDKRKRHNNSRSSSINNNSQKRKYLQQL